MFKFMRKNKTARDVIIIIVVILMASYVVFSFGEAPPRVQEDTLATIGSAKIKFRDAQIKQEQYRQFLSGANRDMLDQFVANALVQEAFLLNGAKTQGIYVSDDELRDYVIQMRTDQDGGFISDDVWADYISRKYNLQVETFESYLRERELALNKFRALFRQSVYVSPKEIEELFHTQNTKASIDMISVPLNSIQYTISVSDEELQAFYDDHQGLFEIGETRQIKYLNWDPNTFKDRVKPSDEQIKQHYEENIARYQIQEQVKASHILIKTDDGKTDEQAKAEIDKIKAEIDGGLDFAEAAIKYSADGSASRGGDLGFFGRGRMVPEFEQVAFSQPIDVISAPVKSQFGYHLIQVKEKKEAHTRPLDEVRTSIIGEIQRRDARPLAKEEADKFLSGLGEKDLEEAANEAGLTITTSEFFDNDPLSQIDNTLRSNSQVRNAVFALNEVGERTGVIETGSAMVIAKLADKQEKGIVPNTPENKSRIRRIVQGENAKLKIENAFSEIRDAIAKDPAMTLGDFKDKYDFLRDNHFIESPEFTADSLPPQLDRNATDFKQDIFDHEIGSFLDGLKSQSDQHYLLARLTKKETPDDSKLEESRAQLTNQLRNQRSNDFMSAFLFAQQKKFDPDQENAARIRAKIAPRKR